VDFNLGLQGGSGLQAYDKPTQAVRYISLHNHVDGQRQRHMSHLAYISSTLLALNNLTEQL